MTSQRPERPEPFDAFETRLATRVTRHAERGVRPIDAGLIAHQAATAGGRPGGTGRAGAAGLFLGRLGWLLAGAALAAGLIGGASWAGSHGLLGAVATPSPTLVAVVPTLAPTAVPSSAPTTAPTPVVTPKPTVAPLLECRQTDLTAVVTRWDGAAGNRIATVVLTNMTTIPCQLQTMDHPQLVDGTGTVLIDGDDPTTPGLLTLAPGATVSTELDDANYCGPAAKAPVTVAFVFTNGDKLVARPRTASDMTGLPDCLGPGGPGQITMHPWAP